MATIRKVTLKSGKTSYKAIIRLAGLKPIYKTFSTKKLATEYARKVEGDKDIQQDLGKVILTNIPFRKVANDFVMQSTARDHSLHQRIFYWIQVFGDKNILEITDLMIDKELEKLNKNRTGATVNRYKGNLSSVFNYFNRLKANKHLKLKNPVRSDIVDKYPPSKKMERFLSEDEQQRLLDACKESSWNKLYLLVLMALNTGARKSEMTDLKWSDIDFKMRTASLAMTKNGKPRMLPLSKLVIKELMKFREIGDTFIFKSQSTGKPFEFRKQWIKALKQASIDNCRFHDLRHTCASNLARNGFSLLQIGALLGHTNTQTTQRYAHLCVKDTLNMVDELSEKMGVC